MPSMGCKSGRDLGIHSDLHVPQNKNASCNQFCGLQGSLKTPDKLWVGQNTDAFHGLLSGLQGTQIAPDSPKRPLENISPGKYPEGMALQESGLTHLSWTAVYICSHFELI